MKNIYIFILILVSIIFSQDCDDNMLMFDCDGIDFCNNEPDFGFDCYVNNEFCEDFNEDGITNAWLGDGWCDNMGGCAWEGPQYDCVELGYDCGDCNEDWDGNNSTGLCADLPCVPSYDANADGIVNILDVIMVVNLILGTGDLDCSIDYDNDGVVNVLDLVIMINIILDGE